MSAYILSIKNVSKQFPGVKALDNVKFDLKKGSVHALMGENGAGKSTLMKCLFGIYKMDKGAIILDGEQTNFTSPKDALEKGVSMVHQELIQVKSTRVMDNIWLGRFPKKKLFIDERKMYQATKDIFKELEIDVDPKTKVSSLEVSKCQMIEIAKAVSYDSKVIVMDEPTSSLTESEVNHLFRIIKNLQRKGISIIYISHKMEEINQICDQVTVLRDGKYISTHNISDVTTDDIIREMVGRDLSQRFPAKVNKPGEVLMQVKNLTAVYQPSIRNVSFDLRKGEILGIAGLVGSKRTDLVEAIFKERKSRGTIMLHGRSLKMNNQKQAIKKGFALITEERRATGIFPEQSVMFNATIANIRKYQSSIGLLSNSNMKKDASWVIDSMNVKTPTMKTKIMSLSGGNQQKVIIGRWLLTAPEVLLMDEPTRGIDVGAKHEIYKLMINLASEGKGIIMVSSEMPELLGVTDRILVMSNGLVAGIVETANTSQEEILALSSKYL